MDKEFLTERVALIRKMAETADPFSKRRLLDLAERYDRALPRLRSAREKLEQNLRPETGTRR